MSKFKHSPPALFLPVFVVLEQSESDVLLPIWKVPVFTRPQPPVRDVSEGSGMCGLCADAIWGTGRQPLASLLEAALSCYCPKLLTLSLGISASSAEPAPELPLRKPTGPALALGRASLTAELLQHLRSEPMDSAWRALISSSRVEQTAGKRHFSM